MDYDNLRFEPLRDSERSLGMQVTTCVLTDEEIMTSVATYHASGSKCAVVTILEKGDFSDGYVGGEDAIRERFQFVQVSQALEEYDPENSI